MQEREPNTSGFMLEFRAPKNASQTFPIQVECNFRKLDWASIPGITVSFQLIEWAISGPSGVESFEKQTRITGLHANLHCHAM